MIDPSSRIGEGFLVGDDPDIGAFCSIGVDGPATASAGGVGSRALIRSHSVVYRGAKIGPDFTSGHGILIRENCRIGSHVSVGSHTILERDVMVGDGVRIHSGCFIPEQSVLGAGSWIGPRVTFTNARYPNRPDTKERLEGVRVEPGAVVGANCTVLPGITIGRGALIGAGAVVVADVAPGAIVVGNPGRALPNGKIRTAAVGER